MSGQPKEPLAVVDGEAFEQQPSSLYIPPEAMRVFLERFSGPLDLLLYLVRRDRIDIREIPVADITSQYVAYVEQVISLQLDLAAEYLMMSAVLIEIKSRMLLPRADEETEEDAEDPRAELVRRLIAYERIKDAALRIGDLPRCGRDFLYAHIEPVTESRPKPKVDPEDLASALAAAADRKQAALGITMERERMSLQEAMSIFMSELSERGKSSFYRMFRPGQPVREQLGAMMMALLELANENLIKMRQESWDDAIVVQLPGDARDVS